MTTPPPDKQPAAETLEEISERLAELAQDSIVHGEVEQAIISALRNRDERAVRIINEHQALDKCEDNCWTAIKAAIREGK